MASMGISLLQKGHILVVGAASTTGAGFLSLFILLITIKSTNDTIKKFITAEINVP